jgi:acyl carrier protein
MTPEQARNLLGSTLREIVPDADLDALPSGADLRSTYELDSMDVVELVERLSKRAGFRIEDDDAWVFDKVDDAVAVLASRDPSG